MTTKPFYLAGPMTNIPLFNFPAFTAAAAHLRSHGFELIVPSEQDSPAVQAAALRSTNGSLDADGKIGGETWGHILAKDVIIVADIVQGIILLPGWEKSRGARLECFVGTLCDRTFDLYSPSPGDVWRFNHNAHHDFIAADPVTKLLRVTAAYVRKFL